MARSDASSSDEGEAQPTHHEQLYSVVELAQLCHFCSTFRAPLKLPLFSRTELQAALIAGTNGDGEQVALLAEVHYKLAREQSGVKLEKMLQDWEKTVIRKVNEHWRLEFASNPFAEATSYDGLSVSQRIHVLNALCHWKLESCAEIHKHLTNIQKEDETKAAEALRATPIGFDDAGSAYWYFNDRCWVYAEDQPKWQASHLSPNYSIEYADAKRIRLSVNFDASTVKERKAIARPPLSPPSPPAKPAPTTAGKMDISMLVGESDVKSPEANDVMNGTERTETQSPNEIPPTDVKPVEVKSENRKMDIHMLCGSPTPSEDTKDVKEEIAEDEQPVKADMQNDEEDRFMKTIVSKRNVEPSQAVKQESQDVKTEEPHDMPLTSKKRQIVHDEMGGPTSEQEVPRDKTTSTSMSSPKKKKLKTDTGEEQLHPDDVKMEKVDEMIKDVSGATAPAPPDSSNNVENETDDYDILCAACQGTYDRRYLDPPLDKRPVGDWRCFECLVNDARGWPRRRPSNSSKSPAASQSADGDEEPSKSRSKSSSSSSRRKSSSSSSSKHKSKPSSGSSSSKKKSSSSSKHKKSSKSSKKSSSSSSSKKKHKKSSSSSRHHHSSSRHRDEYAKLLSAFHTRKRERFAIEVDRRNGVHLCPIPLDGPTGWRVVCSTLDSLRDLTHKLAGGSLEQERLRGRLILILKDQEKLEDDLRKKRELMWNVLPRRQSSRIATTRIKSQRYSDDDSDEDHDVGDGEDGGGRRSRSSRLRRGASNSGTDGKERLALDRESRVRRRHQLRGSDDESDDQDEDDQGPDGVSSVRGWVDWGKAVGERRLAIICLAFIDRLLQEEIAELFARPVDPDEDGCPDYLTVIQHPMDLGTIRARLEAGYYQTWDAFKGDVERVWSNCRTYNAPDMVVVQYANTLAAMCKTMYKDADRKGVRKMRDGPSSDRSGKHLSSGRADEPEDDEEDADMDKSSSEGEDDGRKKSETESSASEVSSDDDDDSDDDSDASSDTKAKRKPASRQPARPTRTSRSTGTRSTGSRTNKRTRRRQDSSDEESASEADSDELDAKPRRLSRGGPPSARNGGVARSMPTRNGSFSSLPPQVNAVTPDAAKKPKRRNQIESSESSDSDGKAKSGSSGSDSDTPLRIRSRGEPRVPAPPPPASPPPPPPPPPSSSAINESKGKSSRDSTDQPRRPPQSPGSSSSSYFSSSGSASSDESPSSDSDSE